MNRIKNEYSKIKAPENTKDIILNKTVFKKKNYVFKYSLVTACLIFIIMIGLFSVNLKNNKVLKNTNQTTNTNNMAEYIIGNEKVKQYVIYSIQYMSGNDNKNTMLWPTESTFKITSLFGKRSNDSMHNGIDIATYNNTKDVYSVYDGKVIASGYSEEFDEDYGKILIIKLENGYYTLFAHLSKINVEVGDNVKKGDLVAEIGSTGSVTGDCLHYGIYDKQPSKNIDSINPTLFYIIEEERTID